MSNWYYAKHGVQYGPVPLEVIQQMSQHGELRSSDLVWTQGMDAWRPLSTVNPAGTQTTAPRAPQRYTPHVEQTADGLGAAAVTYASFGGRLVAALIDSVVVFLGSLVVGFVIGLIWGAMGADAEAISGPVGLLSIVANWLYFAGMESSRYGATLGKRAMRLRVTALDGGPVSFGKATGRYFGKALSTLPLLAGYFAMLFTEKSQCWHDSLAGCLVVDDR